MRPSSHIPLSRDK